MFDFIELAFEQLPLESKQRIDTICARFEKAWRTGRPLLEAFYVQAPPPEQLVLLAELLHIEIECRHGLGETPALEDYTERFPGRESLIRTILIQANQASQSDNLPRPAFDSNPPGPIQPPGYELLGEIGRGGMGVVFRARHLPLNREVALKFILAGSSATLRHLERFRREAEVIARLRHPNIIQIYDIGEVNRHWFLALEYADAGSLRERLKGTPLAPMAAARIMEPLAKAVLHAHRRGVIHLDIKPANVLLSIGGDSMASESGAVYGVNSMPVDGASWVELPPLSMCVPRLTDFGLARLHQNSIEGELGLTGGTPGYMSPEQASGGECGPASDIWSLGVTLYELITGNPPFQAESATETLKLVVRGQVTPPRQLNRGIPEDLEAICLKCLQKDPAGRYANARDLARDLGRFLAGEPVQAQVTRSETSRRRWLLWVAVGIGIVILGAVFVGILIR